MLLSLAVASFTRSQVISMAWIDAATEGRVFLQGQGVIM